MGSVVVIGAGPAGMICASAAAQSGNQVVLIEKNKILGKKLLITGKGRCNITNNCSHSDFFDNIPVNASFLYSAFYTFDNQAVIDFFEKYGVKTKVERGERVFPQSDKSSDVVAALKKCIDQNNVKILQHEVKSLYMEDNLLKGVILGNNSVYKCDKVVIATGGMSYKNTGSTGDGYRLAIEAGHSITPLKPSLVPLECSDEFIPDLMGLSLKNVEIKAVDSKNKVIYSDFGEMLFTHFGLSGPLILSLSSHINGDEKLFIDLKPALTHKKLDERILRDFSVQNNKNFSNCLNELLPKKIIPVIVRLSGIDPFKKVHQITQEERLKLVTLMKEFSVTIKGKRPIEEAIITSGGINIKEINPSTMESKIMKNLYFAGEIIDVEGYTGGFNLQIAFSTGYLAGIHI